MIVSWVNVSASMSLDEPRLTILIRISTTASDCIGGHFTDPKEQNTHPSPDLGAR